MTKEIRLTKGEYAIVDDEDYDELVKYKWYLSGLGYACRDVRLENGKNKTTFMHRQIVNTPPDMSTDHINGNKTDNRKNNLRICNNSDNLKNRNKHKNGTSSIYKGVYWFKLRKKWRAQITVNSKNVYLGFFPNEAEAAKAYNKAATKYYGEFARLNEVKNDTL